GEPGSRARRGVAGAQARAPVARSSEHLPRAVTVRLMRPPAEQTILVTGATDGLGRALAADLAASGADVLVHGRDEGRGHDTLAEIREAAPGVRVRFVGADLASLAEVSYR